MNSRVISRLFFVMPIFELDSVDLWFPNPEWAQEDGVLAVGGDLTPERLMLAYSQGIFPWYDETTPLIWYSPHERFVLFPPKLKVSKSMRNFINQNKYRVTFNRNFKGVIAKCATINREGQEGTWITADMQEAYIKLHELGYAHSVETWYQGEIVGGLYGVQVGEVFCGESMFSTMSNASKMALIWLCRNKQYKMIDCRVYTEHLESMGAEMISREEYIRMLNE